MSVSTLAADGWGKGGFALASVRNWLKEISLPYRRVFKRVRDGRLGLNDFACCCSLSFSQFGEDRFLASYFADQSTGFYVDVGAFHPVLLSNTYLLYRKGWHGINIEPNPEGHAEFVKHRRRDVNLSLAISSTARQVEFTCNGVFSGIDDSTHLFRSQNPLAKRMSTQTQPLAGVLSRHVPAGCSIDFLSVDCEGHDLEVLRSNDWSRFRPRVALVEDHQQSPGTQMDREMEQYGYVYYCRLQLTKLYLEEAEAAKQLPVARQRGFGGLVPGGQTPVSLGSD